MVERDRISDAAVVVFESRSRDLPAGSICAIDPDESTCGCITARRRFAKERYRGDRPRRQWNTGPTDCRLLLPQSEDACERMRSHVHRLLPEEERPVGPRAARHAVLIT